jgi:S-adenosylmethionine synthetase
MQSPEIAQGVDTGGAGDQGIMIGYACTENDQMVPLEYYFARKLCESIYINHPYDGKTQVTILEDDSLNVVASFQNTSTEDLIHHIKDFFAETNYTINSLHCNPAGEWNLGGFDADTGLTGRKLAVDNYGPRIPLGGGAFSGKDSSKVDRSAAYMARRIATDYIGKYKASEVYVTLAYAIGHDKPLQATALVDGKEIYINDYDLSPKGIVEFLGLKQPIFYETSKWGHMGKNFPWN